MKKGYTHSLVYILILICSVNINAQQDTIEENSDTIITEFGMNMTGLINQLVPFKQVSNRTGPYSVSIKFIKNRNAFRMALGLHLISSTFNPTTPNTLTDIANFNLRLGFERRRIVNEKFNFYQTFDFMMMAGNFNSPINDFEDNETVAGVGLGLGLGIEYLIFENLSLSTEGIGFVGIIGGTSSIFNATVIPPIAIFLNYKF